MILLNTIDFNLHLMIIKKGSREKMVLTILNENS